ncbi:MAG: enolase C-terminal domain-like protein [Candidatus Bathyarchaeia archaeon]
MEIQRFISMMKITSLIIHILKPQEFSHEATRINYPPALIRLQTDEGVEGITMLEESIYADDLVIKFKTLKGWLKTTKEFIPLIGADPLEREKIEDSFWSQYFFQRSAPYTLCAIDECLWDIAGKYFNVPIYRLLGPAKEKLLAYASTQSYDDFKDYEKIIEYCLDNGFKAIKLHTMRNWKKDIELCKLAKDLVGDQAILMLDPYHAYTRYEALIVGKVLEKLEFYLYEDPIPTTDIDGLVYLRHKLDVPIYAGETIHDLYTYAELIQRGAVDGLKCIDVNVGGITGMLKVAHLAEIFGLMCEPHSWGHPWQQAAHLHVMLAIRNCQFFEMPVPIGILDYCNEDSIRLDKDGYVYCLSKPGLGIDPDWDEVEKRTIKKITVP